jgi:hypothetical protein
MAQFSAEKHGDFAVKAWIAAAYAKAFIKLRRIS